MSTNLTNVQKDFTALLRWISENRNASAMLSDDADTLSLEILRLQHQLTALVPVTDTPPVMALYGHNRQEKSRILKALLGNKEKRINLTLGQRKLDYLEHLIPEHSSPSMAIRFSHDKTVHHEAQDLMLTLLTESELVQLFISHYHRSGHAQPLNSALLYQRLNSVYVHDQPVNSTVMSQQDVTAIIDCHRQITHSPYPQLDDETAFLLVQNIPCMGLNDRANCFSLLWGEDKNLTRQWLDLAAMLTTLNHARQVSTPLSLLVDRYLLSTEALMLPTEENTAEEIPEVTVFPLLPAPQNEAVTLPVSLLALLTVELILPLPDAASKEHFYEADIIDIPVYQEPEHPLLIQSKAQFIADICRQRYRPGVVLISQSVAKTADIHPVASMFYRWQKYSPFKIVWLTSSTRQMATAYDNEERLRTLLTAAGITCELFSADGSHSTHSMLTWIKHILASETKIDSEKKEIYQHMERLFSLYNSVGEEQHVLQTENVLRVLQKQASRLGDLAEDLMPPKTAVQRLCAFYQKETSSSPAIFSDDINLLDDPQENLVFADEEPRSSLATSLHRLWVNYLRYWATREDTVAGPLLSRELRMALAETLIVASYRLSLHEKLAQESTRNNGSPILMVSGTMQVFSRFITWLGYAGMPLGQRPVSRWNQGTPLFTRPQILNTRLTRLDEHPQHAATAWVYDWLTGLLALARENKIWFEETMEHASAIRLSALLNNVRRTLLE